MIRRNNRDKNATVKRTRRIVESEITIEIGSVLCRDVWSKIVEFCDTREWLKSYTCKGINQFKFDRLLMFNKMKTLKHEIRNKGIEHWFGLCKGTLFNVCFNWHPYVMDEHFQFLKGIHTLYMNGCYRITANAFPHLTGIHTLHMSYCKSITDSAFPYLTGIHTLHMIDCFRITDDAFSHLTGIHTLNMSDCNQITDNAFQHLVGVHTLDMSRCKNVTDDAFSHLSGVHTLNMSGCEQESITVKVLPYLTGVRVLYWSNSKRDNAFIEKVVEHCDSNATTLIGMKRTVS